MDFPSPKVSPRLSLARYNLKGQRARRTQPFGRAKEKGPPLRAALCKIDHRDEKFSSLADLAATYSSKP